LAYPRTVRFAFIAFPYPSSPSPTIGKLALVASLHVRPTSTISPYEINPVSGSANLDADTQNPDMNAAENPARSIRRALSASCAHGA
jgi:hypothetical protein